MKWHLSSAALVGALLNFGCTSPTVNPGPTPYFGPSVCANTARFDMTVNQGNTTPVVSLVRGILIVNGEEKGMTPATSSPWGMYTYFGSVPHDGEIRYRYLFRYFTGVAGSSGPYTVYGPDNRYLTTTVTNVAWTSPREIVIPDDRIEDPFWRMPRRLVSLLDLFTPNFSGSLTQSADLVLKNELTVPIQAGSPRIVDRRTGAAIPGLTISPAASVITIQGGSETTYRVTAQRTITNGQAVFWEAGVTIPIGLLGGPGTCNFGPIWVNVTWSVNPS